MIRVFENRQEDLKLWMSQRLHCPENSFDRGYALGIADDSEFLGAVVFHNGKIFSDGSKICEAGIATNSPRWATRKVLQTVFDYPFNNLGVKCLRTLCPADSSEIMIFNERLGFKFEGIARLSFDGTRDAAVFSMLPDECKWLRA